MWNQGVITIAFSKSCLNKISVCRINFKRASLSTELIVERVEKNSRQLKRNRHLQSIDPLMTPQGLLLRCDGGGEGGWP